MAGASKLREFLARFGSLIVRPYRTDRFDFGAPTFHQELQARFREASELRETTGSPHFVFLNKVLVGIFNLMGQLGPVIDTRRSRALLEGTVTAL